MRTYNLIGIFSGMGALLLLSPTCSELSAAPSAAMSAAQQTQLPAIEVKTGDVSGGCMVILERLRSKGSQYCPCVGVETDSGTATASSTSAATIPAGRFQDQVEKLAELSGYVVNTDGDWLNFIPKEKATDPDYVMNVRIPGKVVLSRDAQKYTSIGKWMSDHHIQVFWQLVGLAPDPSRPTAKASYIQDPTILESPSLREHANMHYALRGHNLWIVSVKTMPPTEKNPYRSFQLTYQFGDMGDSANE